MKLPVKLNVDFACLLAVLIANQATLWSSSVAPLHDSMYVFQAFQFYYGNYLDHAELVAWLPHGTYGVPSFNVQLACFSPFTYLVGVVGVLFHATNVLLLFKFALLAEQVFFLTGLYLLSRRLYESRLTTLTICLVALLTVNWRTQLFFEWRLFYAMPFALYLLTLFFEGSGPHYVWLAGIVTLFSLVGSAAYFISLLFLTFVVVALVWLTIRPCAAGYFCRLTGANVLCFLSFMVLSSVYVWQASRCLDGLAVLSEGRDPSSGKVTLDCFLNYGRPDRLTALQGMLTGWPPYGDNTYYIGLFPLAFVIWALLHRPSPRFWAFFIPGLVLVLLSSGEFFARLLYRFPGMAYYRHVGLVYGPVRLLLLVCAGFGLDAFQRCVRENDLSWLKAAPLLAACLLGLLPFDSYLEKTLEQLSGSKGAMKEFEEMNRILVCSRLGLYCGVTALAVTLGLTRLLTHGRVKRILAVTFGLVCLFDVVSYRCLAQAAVPRPPGSKADLRALCGARHLEYCSQRQDSAAPQIQKVQDVFESFPKAPGQGRYSFAYNVLQYDPSYSRYRVDLLPQRVGQLIFLRGGQLRQWPSKDFLPEGDAWLRQTLGCSAPKLQLVKNPFIACSDEGSLQAISRLPKDSTAVVITAPSKADSSTGSATKAQEPSGTIRVLDFSANRLVVETEVTDSESAWLVYADSFHKGWRCTVNDLAVPIRPANLAFKGVPVGRGKSKVVFQFNGGRRACAAYLVASAGLLFAAWALTMTVLVLLGAESLGCVKHSQPAARFHPS
jgi:hypothetical protein